MISHHIIDNTGNFIVKAKCSRYDEGTAKPLIRSKRAYDAVVRLPHSTLVPISTSQLLTQSYSLIEGEYEGPSSPPRLKKVVVKSKILKS